MLGLGNMFSHFLGLQFCACWIVALVCLGFNNWFPGGLWGLGRSDNVGFRMQVLEVVSRPRVEGS